MLLTSASLRRRVEKKRQLRLDCPGLTVFCSLPSVVYFSGGDLLANRQLANTLIFRINVILWDRTALCVLYGIFLWSDWERGGVLF